MPVALHCNNTIAETDGRVAVSRKARPASCVPTLGPGAGGRGEQPGSMALCAAVCPESACPSGAGRARAPRPSTLASSACAAGATRCALQPAARSPRPRRGTAGPGSLSDLGSKVRSRRDCDTQMAPIAMVAWDCGYCLDGNSSPSNSNPKLPFRLTGRLPVGCRCARRPGAVCSSCNLCKRWKTFSRCAGLVPGPRLWAQESQSPRLRHMAFAGAPGTRPG